jgi:hypothetical protein
MRDVAGVVKEGGVDVREDRPPRLDVHDGKVLVVEPEIVVAAERVVPAERWHQVERDLVAGLHVAREHPAVQRQNPARRAQRNEVRGFRFVLPEAERVGAAIRERGHRGTIEAAVGRVTPVVARIRRYGPFAVEVIRLERERNAGVGGEQLRGLGKVRLERAARRVDCGTAQIADLARERQRSSRSGRSVRRIGDDVPAAHPVLTLVVLERILAKAEVVDLRLVLPHALHAGREVMVGEVRHLEASLDHLVEMPGRRGRCVEEAALVEDVLPIAGTERHPARTGDHVRRLQVRPALRLAGVAELVDRETDAARQQLRLGPETRARRRHRARGARLRGLRRIVDAEILRRRDRRNGDQHDEKGSGSNGS